MFTERGLVVSNGPHQYRAEPVDSVSMFAHVLNISEADLRPWPRYETLVRLVGGVSRFYRDEISFHQWREIRCQAGLFISRERLWNQQVELYALESKFRAAEDDEDTLHSEDLVTEEYIAPDACRKVVTDDTLRSISRCEYVRSQFSPQHPAASNSTAERKTPIERED